MKILIVLGNHILSEALQELIEKQSGENEIALYDANDFWSGFEPEIILFDSCRCDQELFYKWPEAKFVLVDTGLEEQDLVCLLMYQKIDGIISPELDRNLFNKALKMVSEGQVWISQKNLKALISKAGGRAHSASIRGLSKKDQKIVELITHGYTNKEIAEKIFLSEQTIKAHVSNIFKKLSVSNRTQLVSLVVKNKVGPS